MRMKDYKGIYVMETDAFHGIEKSPTCLCVEDSVAVKCATPICPLSFSSIHIYSSLFSLVVIVSLVYIYI